MELLPIRLNRLKEEIGSLKFKANFFNELLSYLNPCKSQFQWSLGYEHF